MGVVVSEFSAQGSAAQLQCLPVLCASGLWARGWVGRILHPLCESKVEGSKKVEVGESKERKSV